MLKKIIAIHLLLLFLLGLFQVGVTTHICCGKPVKSKIIFGKGLASCGMEENTSHDCSKTKKISRQCCENVINKFEFQNEFNFQNDESNFPVENQIHFYYQPLFFASISNLNHIEEIRANPPPYFCATSVDLSNIRVLRI